MADNTVLNAGTGGDTIASDDIGGIKYQRVKPTIGADGTATDVIPISNGLDTTGAAVPAVGIVGQLDDTTTSAVTENQFAPVRISSRRALLVEGVASGTALPVSAASLPLPSGASTETTLGTRLSESDFDTKVGALTETAPATDTASSGLNGRLQRVAQRLTSLIALLPTSLGAGGGLKVDGSGTALPVSGTVSVTGVATETTLGTRLSESDFDTKVGSLIETAPASDTASSGLNGRLQRIAQRLTTLIGLLPSALGANGGLKIEGVASGTVVPVTSAKPATATLSNVADSATSVTVLASNTSRLGAIFYNDSTAVAYVKFGATASTTSFVKKMLPGDMWDITTTGYTGLVAAIWASAAGGAMRVTELTA